MPTYLSSENHNLSRTDISASFSLFVNLLRRTFVAALLVGLIWLPGLPVSSALAVSSPPSVVTVPVQSDRLNALVSCLPKQLSQPNRERTWSEMSNDQLERVLNLKANPKLSQAETELAACLNGKGFAPQG